MGALRRPRSGTLLWDFWNGASNAARVAALEAGGRWRVGNGTVALPSLSFLSDTDSGFYRIGANRVGLALGGSRVVDFSGTGMVVSGTMTVDNVTYPGTLAAGDILYASAANTLTRLPKGSDGEYIKLAAGIPSWATLPSGATVRGAGDGLVLDGNDLDVNVGNGLEISSDAVRVRLSGSTLGRTASGMSVLGCPASGITGTLAAARIPGLAASKITSGTFNTDRIPNLNASKINAGTLDDARIPASIARDSEIPTVPTERIPVAWARVTVSGQTATVVGEGFASATVVSGSGIDMVFSAGVVSDGNYLVTAWQNSGDLSNASIITAAGFRLAGSTIHKTLVLVFDN